MSKRHGYENHQQRQPEQPIQRPVREDEVHVEPCFYNRVGFHIVHPCFGGERYIPNAYNCNYIEPRGWLAVLIIKCRGGSMPLLLAI